MSRTRKLTHAPSLRRLSMRAALAVLPGASRLAGVAGGGGEIPLLSLTLAGARLDPDRLLAYERVCGFAESRFLPASAPHLLAFPLHMALMTDGSFPFAPVGLVHLSNRIVVDRPIAASEPLDISVSASSLQPHPKGRIFSISTEAHVGEERVWHELSTMLRRGPGTPGGEREVGRPGRHLTTCLDWRLAADLGRRYASVSGDRNPIHLYSATARLFGFPRAIAHGMWTKAHCLAMLGASLPQSFTVDVVFRRPIMLPGRVGFAQERRDARTDFAVRAIDDETTVHLEGAVTA